MLREATKRKEPVDAFWYSRRIKGERERGKFIKDDELLRLKAALATAMSDLRLILKSIGITLPGMIDNGFQFPPEVQKLEEITLAPL